MSTVSRSGKFFLSTAINYTNGLPHMGHAYEAVVADILARYHRNFGRNTFMMTGTDEHGQKIAQTAAADPWNCHPIELCDFYANHFMKLDERLKVDFDVFVRTTSDVHKQTARHLWSEAMKTGDIYLSEYVGWYNTREETYITEAEAEASNFKDPISGVPLTRMSESSYFFNMSKYQQALIDHINTNPDFIVPSFRRNEILSRLNEPLMDLCISRTKFSWGVPVPPSANGTNEHEGHVMYVWFDALANYLTGVDYFKLRPNAIGRDGAHLNHFWNSGVTHLIGKDILWFHAVIWPTILMATNIALPKHILAHGHINAADGLKMSKSLGNVVNANDCLDIVGTDSFRYYVVQAAEVGNDFPFIKEQMIDLHNAVLNDQLGNLIHRATNMTVKYCDGKVPAKDVLTGIELPSPIDSAKVAANLDVLFSSFKISEALTEVINCIREANKFLQTQQPWAKEKTDAERVAILRAIIEQIHFIGHIVEPFMPYTGEAIINKLGGVRVPINAFIDAPQGSLIPGGVTVTVGEPLFTKVRDPAVVAAEEAAVADKEAAAAAKKTTKVKPDAVAANENGTKEERKAAKAARRAAALALRAEGGDAAIEEDDE